MQAESAELRYVGSKASELEHELCHCANFQFRSNKLELQLNQAKKVPVFFHPFFNL